MTANNSENTPTVTLAGRAWAVPTLAPRQNRIAVPALLALVPKILRARDEAEAAGEKGSYATLARTLDTESYDTLSTLVFTAITRAHPGLARTEFDDMAIDTFELIAAVAPIARAAGLIRTELPPPPLSRSPSPTLRAGEEA
jgi:hypothetical protein